LNFQAIDRMEATVVASVRAVRQFACGAGFASGKVRSKVSATKTAQDFEAPTEAISAGLLS
jgi:hypothetical protein